MKRLLLGLFMACGYSALCAQESTQNYINDRILLNEAGNSFLNNSTYYDGIGRPFQTVKKAVKNGIQTGSILATLQEYDTAGREANNWLPIVISSDYIDPATFKNSAPGSYNNDSRSYNQPVYEASPLNRILQQYGPGAAWFSNHPVAIEYLANTTTAPLSCANYSVDSTGELANNGSYAANQLNIVKTTDEDGNISYTFNDKLDHTLLTRQMKGSEMNDTYYVYDDSNNLRFVLQPMYQTSANLDQYAFQYKYDGCNRCIWKKLPGVQHAEYVYDTADRLIFSQDGNQHASNRWTFYMYDNLNRLTRQGECTGQNPSASDAVTYQQNYYDDYSFRSQTGFNNSNFPDGGTTGKGYLTGSITTVLESNDKIYSANYYDIKGRVTGSVHNNLLGGYDITSTLYTFSDKPATVTHTHTATGKTTRMEINTYTYDHADRVSKVQHTLGGTTVTLYDAAYDNLGRLSTKSLHGSATNKLAYAYNIRSWLAGITGTPFTQNLYYNTGNGTPCYNGNISSMTWNGNDGITRGYKFSYDGLNRMLTAAYGETATINTNINRFTENVTSYDKNGNILGLQRYGQTGASAYGLVDNLTMSLNGNQLTTVNDAATASAYNGGFEFKNGANTANECAYDANGNLTKDLNKNITDIQYNFLNLPSKITFDDGSTIVYLYSADGTKLRTTHAISGTVTTTDYCNNVIYENNTATQLLTEAGYVSLNDNKYHYYLQDHQGNNRVVVDQNGTVEETNNYYPFGGVFANTNNVQPYKYNGKEFDSEKGLNWYDYGARHYDAALGKFTTIDLLAEKCPFLSPYAYCANNPIRFVDPDGCEFTDDAWEWINKLIADVNSRQVSNNTKIADKQAKLDAGGLSARQTKRLNRQMEKLQGENAQLESVRSEVATLAASNQMYDVKTSDAYSSSGFVPGTGTDVAGATFNFSNGNFEIIMPSSGGLNLFSHELKHAYQFETGAYSVGPELSGAYKNFLYDKYDEVEAYNRGALFGGTTYSVNSLPLEYNTIATGPVDATTHPNISGILSMPLDVQKKAFQNIANTTKQAFRINGITYYKPR